MITPMDAVQSLRPNSECVVRGFEVEFLDGSAPLTPEQVEAEVARLEATAAETAASAAQARADAIAHAKSLGFTDAMIAVMYPNLQMGA